MSGSAFAIGLLHERKRGERLSTSILRGDPGTIRVQGEKFQVLTERGKKGDRFGRAEKKKG